MTSQNNHNPPFSKNIQVTVVSKRVKAITCKTHNDYRYTIATHSRTRLSYAPLFPGLSFLSSSLSNKCPCTTSELPFPRLLIVYLQFTFLLASQSSRLVRCEGKLRSKRTHVRIFPYAPLFLGLSFLSSSFSNKCLCTTTATLSSPPDRLPAIYVFQHAKAQG